MDASPPENPPAPRGSVGEVFAVFLLLGLTSFGGPVAHLGYFRDALVVRRRWLTDSEYADLVALCQFLPGPASSQVGIAIGQLRAGTPGAFAAWLAFTLPSAALMVAAAWGLIAFAAEAAPLLHGLKLAALAVVAQAVWQMGKALAPDTHRQLVVIAAAIVVLLAGTAWMQVAVIATAALLGWLRTAPAPSSPPALARSRGWLLLVAFFALLAGLPLLALATGDAVLGMIERYYTTGSLVFGGGHVVLPLLEGALVTPGRIAASDFLAGYGAAQALPGPLFAFAAYTGTLESGLFGGVLALLAIYLPSFLLVLGILPYWQQLRAHARLRGALNLANAAVVGLLLAVLYDPVFTSAVGRPADLAVALTALATLVVLRLPSWLVVAFCAAAGWGLAVIG